MAKDTPLGKGIIKIEADITALERSLAEAKGKVQAAGTTGGRTAYGSVNPVDFGAGSSRAGATGGAVPPPTGGRTPTSILSGDGGKTPRQSIDEAAEATDNLAEKTKSVRDAIKEQIAPLTNVIKTIKLVTGTVSGLLGVWGLVIEPVKMLLGYFEDQAKALGDVKRAASEAAGEIWSMTNNSLMAAKRSKEGAERVALLNEYNRRKDFIEKEYQKQFDLAMKLSGDKRQIEMDRIKSEEIVAKEKLRNIYEEDSNRLADQQRARAENERQNREFARREDDLAFERSRAKKDAAADEELRYGTESLKAELAGPRAQIEFKYSEQIRQINARRSLERRYDSLKFYDEQIALVEQVKAKELAEFDKLQQEKLTKEQERLAETAKIQQDLQKEIARQTIQLQKNINELFNTGQIEVGINRVAGLIQVLIEKTGR